MAFSTEKEFRFQKRFINESESMKPDSLALPVNLFGRENPGALYSTLDIENSGEGYSFTGELFCEAGIHEVLGSLEDDSHSTGNLPFVFWKQKTIFTKEQAREFLIGLTGGELSPFKDAPFEEIKSALRQYDFGADIGNANVGGVPELNESEGLGVDVCSISHSPFADDPLLRLFPLRNKNAFPRALLSNHLNSKIARFLKNKSYLSSWDKKLFSWNGQSPIDKIKAYDVGQADFLVGYCAGSPCFCFDIGLEKSDFFSMGKTPLSPHQQSMQFLSNLNDKGVIFISHYDIDHFLGFGLADLSNKSSFAYRKWILPDPRILMQNGLFPFSFAAFVMLSFLLSRGPSEVYLLSWNAWAPKKLKNVVFTHSLGRDRNDSSLFCVVNDQGNGKKCVLPGDADYSVWPSLNKGINFNNVDYLIVPHHGGKATITNIPKANPDAKAVVLCGKNSYGHPNHSHIYALANNQFCVLRFPILHSSLFFYSASHSKGNIDNISQVIGPGFYTMPL